MNCQIKKVIVSISSLGSTLSSDHLTVHVYASNEAEKLLVGRLDFVGKTLSGFKRSLTVICPDGFELSAIAVDEFGALHPFNDRWGITVADDLYCPRGGFLTPEKAMSKELSYAAGRDAVQAIVGRYLTGEATEYAEDMIDELMALRSVRWLVIKTSIDASELQSTIDEVLESIRKSDVFKVLSGQTFINDAVIKDGSIRAEWSLNSAFPKSDLRLMEPLTDTASACDNIRVLNKPLFGINPFSTAIVKLSDEMRDAVIAAVRESGQFVEKPTGDEQQSVVFQADCFKATAGVNDSGESTIQQQIQQAANAVIEATKAALARQDAAMAAVASEQAALTERINQAVNDAIANALRPGGALYAFRTRT
ncbi:hypothetical protein ACP3TG_08310 [Phytobacter diazotrophicus]